MNFLLYLFIGKKSSDKFVPGHLRQKRGRRTGSVHMSRASRQPGIVDSIKSISRAILIIGGACIF